MSSSSDSNATKKTLSIRETFEVLARGSRGYLMVNIINIGEGVAYFGILAVLTLYLQHDAGFSVETAHSRVSDFTGLVTLFMIPGGIAVDLLGVRRGFTLAMVLMLIGRLFLLGPGFVGAGESAMALALIALCVMALANGVVQPALYAGVKEYADARTASMAYAVLYAAMNLGMAGELLLAPQMRSWWAKNVDGTDPSDPITGMLGPLVLCAVLTAIMLFAHLGVFTKKVEREDRIVPVKTDAERARENMHWVDKLKSYPITNPRFMFFIFILLAVRTLFAHQWLTMPDYITRTLEEPPEYFLAINPIIIVVFVPLITGYTQRVHVLTMMIVGTLITALAPFILVGANSLEIVALYLVVHSLGEAVWSSRFLEYIADMAPAGLVGAYMGLASIPWFAAKWIAGKYSGHMVTKYLPSSGAPVADPESEGVWFRLMHDLVALLPDGGPDTMWTIYALGALVSPIGLILARKWLLSGVDSGVRD